MTGRANLRAMGRGLRIVIGVVAGFGVAHLVRATVSDNPLLFAVIWAAAIAATWLITRPRTA